MSQNLIWQVGKIPRERPRKLKNATKAQCEAANRFLLTGQSKQVLNDTEIEFHKPLLSDLYGSVLMLYYTENERYIQMFLIPETRAHKFGKRSKRKNKMNK